MVTGALVSGAVIVAVAPLVSGLVSGPSPARPVGRRRMGALRRRLGLAPAVRQPGRRPWPPSPGTAVPRRGRRRRDHPDSAAARPRASLPPGRRSSWPPGWSWAGFWSVSSPSSRWPSTSPADRRGSFDQGPLCNPLTVQWLTARARSLAPCLIGRVLGRTVLATARSGGAPGRRPIRSSARRRSRPTRCPPGRSTAWCGARRWSATRSTSPAASPRRARRACRWAGPARSMRSTSSPSTSQPGIQCPSATA